MTDSSVSMRPTSTKVRHDKHQPEPVSTISRTSVNQQPEPIGQASTETTHISGVCRVQTYRADIACRPTVQMSADVSTAREGVEPWTTAPTEAGAGRGREQAPIASRIASSGRARSCKRWSLISGD